MKKMIIDRYLVYEKGREILKFPFIKYMWAVLCRLDCV